MLKYWGVEFTTRETFTCWDSVVFPLLITVTVALIISVAVGDLGVKVMEAGVRSGSARETALKFVDMMLFVSLVSATVFSGSTVTVMLWSPADTLKVRFTLRTCFPVISRVVDAVEFPSTARLISTSSRSAPE